MGLDVRAKLLVGVHLEPMTESVAKTKYNPDTGEPQKVNERRNYRVIEGTNIEIKTDESTEDLDYNTSRQPQIMCACHDDPNSWFLGIVVAETDSNRSGGTGSLWFRVPDDIDNSRDQIAELLRTRFGYTGSVKVFLINDVSY